MIHLSSPMSIKSLLQSSAFAGFLCGIGVVIVLLFVFHLGMAFGYDRAIAHNAYGRQHEGFGAFDPHSEFNAHGVIGSITSVATNQFVIKTPDGSSRTVNYTSDTRIEKDHTPASSTDLVVDAKVLIFGDSESDGTVSATIIHLFTNLPPLPPASSTNTTPSSL